MAGHRERVSLAIATAVGDGLCYKSYGYLTAADAAIKAAGVPYMIELLAKCASRFREYEGIHLAKGDHASRMKADRNADMAELCEKAIAMVTEDGCSEEAA